MSSPIDLGFVVDMFAYDVLTVVSTTTSYVAGVSTPDAPTTATVYASVQPAAGRDLQRLTEGQRSKGAVTVFSRVSLLMAGATQLSDSFTWRGRSWTIVHSEQWDATGTWRSVATQTEV